MAEPIVHLIFKTHLDLGFTDFAANVAQTYFRQFIPQAVALAQRTREQGDARFRWTTGAWLIAEYLEQASAPERRAMEAAIEVGDILWHALPFTTHTELMDEALFRFALSYSQKLDQRFGRTTIAAKMTDVPGHTRAMIPLLAQAGVRLLHIGVNPASSVPDVPPVFVWRDERTGTEVLVVYDETYGGVTRVPGMSDVLALVLTGDNLGPPSEAAIRETYHQLSEQNPGARVIASSLDDYARALDQVRDQLPVVTSEIGDTWIHGAGTDPTKVRRYRELSRLRRRWLGHGYNPVPLTPDERERIDALSRHLIIIPEHTWGMDEKTHLPDHAHYTAAELARLRQTPQAQQFEASWAEQRAYLDAALSALDGSRLADEARERLAAIEPQPPDLVGWMPTDAFTFQGEDLAVRFSEQTGAVVGLHSAHFARTWADEAHPLALLVYEAFGQADYDRYWEQYIRNKTDPEVRPWAWEDNMKPGLPVSDHREWQPQVSAMFRDGDRAVLFELRFPDDARQVGAPERLYLAYSVDATSPYKLDIALSWFNKPASRLPEAFWLSFVPLVESSGEWYLEKMGQLINPTGVVSRGGRGLHAVNQGVRYHDEHELFDLLTLDAPLVAPGQRSLLNFHNRIPDMRGGVHVNLYNNIWGTNFPMWFEDDALFRFTLRFT